MKVFLVLHHEIMGPLENPRADEMVFYVASSLEVALDLIKKAHVDEWSWWEIQQSDMDSQDWPEHVGLYDLLGNKIDESPYLKCYELYITK